MPRNLTEFDIFNKVGSVMLYHISPVKLKNMVLTPRIPSTLDTGNSENNLISRVCFGRSINGCVSAVPYGGNTLENIRRIWYVYSPIDIDPKYLYQPSKKDVPDVDVTHEIWYKKKCRVKYIGMIFVTKTTKNKKKYIDSRGVVWNQTHKYYKYVKTNYKPPYFIYQLKEKGYDIKKLCGKKWWLLKENNPKDTLGQIVHKWRAITGIELVHPEPTIEEQIRVRKNWDLMTNEMKKVSDFKCKEFYGCDNETNFKQIMKEKWGKCI